MKILHVVSESGPVGRGVPQKVVRTVEAWRRLGVDADFIELATAHIGTTGIGTGDAFQPRFRGEWILEMHRRAVRMRRVLEDAAPDLVYTRELVWSPGLKSILDGFRVVIEVNSDRGEELRARSRAASIFWGLTAPRIRRRAAGLVAVTHELAAKVGSPGIPTTVIANAVKVASTPPKRSCSSNRPLVLMLVGGPAPWQGINRFAVLSESLPQFDFVICGDCGPDGRNLPDTVRVLKPRSGLALDELLSKVSVCFGTMALSRKGMIEACPLKSRTSLAAGIPLVYAYDDPALEGDERFALRIEDLQIQSEATITRIVEFVQKASEEPEIGIEAWEFARRNLDVDIAEKRRIDFFKSVP